MIKRFEPAAQGFSIVKSVSKGLRTDYHRGPKDRFVALAQLQEAKAMADYLAEQLTGGDGLVAAKPEAGNLEAPTAYDQAAALWAYSSLHLALTDADLPLYSRLPDATPVAQKNLGRADALFKAMARVRPDGPRDVAAAIEAYGWYAAATTSPDARTQATARVGELGQRLADAPKTTVDEFGFAVYGLGEAARLTKRPDLSQAAQRLFFTDMERLWDAKAGVYAPQSGSSKYGYTPERTGGVLAAIHSIRWFHRPGVGSSWDPALAEERYRAFFTNVIVRSGFQQAHAIPLAVNPAYLQQEPQSYFTAPSIPLSIEGDKPYGTCPVYAAEAVFESGRWQVTDRTFHTAPAMFLSTVSTWHHGSRPDGFAPV